MNKDKFTQYPHMENIEDYPEIYELPEVVATEKVHGSNMRIGLIDGQIRYGGRKLEFAMISPDSKDGLGFVSWALSTELGKKIEKEFSGTDVIFFGEWFGSGTPAMGWPRIQKGIVYFKGNDFRVFDVKLDGKYVHQDEVPSLAARLGLKTMPVLYRGKPDEKIFLSLVDTVTRVGKENGFDDPENTLEGIVIRPPEFSWRKNGDPVMVKLKIGKWAERASAQRQPKVPKKVRMQAPGVKEFAAEFVTETRLDHILGQMREEGINLDNTAIGEVMKRMGQDIKREGEKTLMEAGIEWKDVSPVVTKGIKEMFLKKIASCL